MRPIRLILPVLLLAAAGLGCTTSTYDKSDQPPKLTVFLVVDQFRADFLDQFEGEWEGGIARLVEEGRIFEKTTHNHAPTNTGPGHATLSGGVWPNKHGAPDNYWFANGERQTMSRDATATPLSRRETRGCTPIQLKTPMLGDWLKKSSPNSKVYGLGWKDRVGVAMGGIHPDFSFWMGDAEWVSSTWYGPALPQWVSDYNNTEPVMAYAGKSWTPLDAKKLARLAPREDDFVGEEARFGRSFPHEIPDTDRTNVVKSAISYMPMQDELTLDFARKLITNEQLGQDDIPDLLGLGLAGTDYLGHRYGPYSQEMVDNLLRLDHQLGLFFDWLDETVGKDQWMVAFSSDHGAAPLPEYSASIGEPGGRLHRDDWRAMLDSVDAALREPRGREKPFYGFAYYGNVWLDFDGEADSCEIMEAFATAMQAQPAITEAFTQCELMAPSTERPAGSELLARGVIPGRSAHIVSKRQSGWLINFSEEGTTHGSGQDYDREVPFIVAGPGVASGTISQACCTTDVAPTLAAAMGIATPDNLDGEARPLR